MSCPVCGHKQCRCFGMLCSWCKEGRVHSVAGRCSMCRGRGNGYCSCHLLCSQCCPQMIGPTFCYCTTEDHYIGKKKE